ncbi:MAG TPA: SRPBCC domain-containing protein [Variovorax sp.]
MQDTAGALGAFTLARTFDAPRERVWKAFAEADRLAQWWGPKGFTLSVASFDLQPGGGFVYSMSVGPQVMWGRFVYREIDRPERIVFVNGFSDAAGGLTRAPFNPAWPLEVLNSWRFTEEGGKTTISMRGDPVNASDAECAVFIASFDSMRMGFGGTFDQLQDYLRKSD